MEIKVDLVELRAQVAEQYRAVVALATTLATVHSESASMTEVVEESILRAMGERSAYFMELLGNELSNMGADDEEEDEWLDPIFENAQLLFPQGEA